MIWHEWEGIRLEPAYNSQFFFWSLKSGTNAFDVFVKFELGDLRAYFWLSFFYKHQPNKIK